MNGRNGRELRDAAWERSLDSGLREVVGGERAPDVTAAVSARHAAGEVVDGGGRVAPASPFRQRWLAAAVLLLGAAAVIATLVANRAGSSAVTPAGGGHDAGAGEASPDAQGPVSVVIRKAQQGEQRELPLVMPWTRIAALPDLLEVEARNLDDAQLAALVAQCPQLTTLRVVAIKGGRGDDPPEPVSITDAALAEVAKLSRLQHLELIGTDGVHGEGLRTLDALPLLQELKLSAFDVDDQSLAVLPRLPSLQVLRLVLNHGFGAAGIDAIAQCPGLRTLELRGCSQLRADWIARLGALPGLLELDLSNIGSTWRVAPTPAPAGERAAERRRVEVAARAGAGMRTEAIAGWPKLQRIMLADNPGLGADVGQALRTKCPSLQYVDLSGCNDVDDTTVAELLGLRQLRTLDLARCPKVTETSFDLLKLAQQLREVRFADCAWLTLERAEQLLKSGKRVVNQRDDAAYNEALTQLVRKYEQLLSAPRTASVESMAELEALPADTTHVVLKGLGDAGAAAVARRPAVRALTVMGGPRITAAGLRDIATMRDLEELIVSADLDDEALQVLPRLGALRTLGLASNAFGRRGVEAVAQCRGLCSLDLIAPQLTDADFGPLATLSALETLDLHEAAGLGDAALHEFARLHELRALVVRSAACTDAGLRALGAMRQLEQLDLTKCERITASGLLELPVGIQRLHLSECPHLGADAGAILRDRFPGLRILDLAQNDWVDDAVVAAVLQLPVLENLSIALCTGTTAASLPRLLEAPASLKLLTATRVQWLTKAAVEELKSRRPGLQVTTFVW